MFIVRKKRENFALFSRKKAEKHQHDPKSIILCIIQEGNIKKKGNEAKTFYLVIRYWVASSFFFGL